MAYQSGDLSVIAYANGYTHWHYTTRDTSTQVTAPGYFDSASTMLRVGDTVTTNTNTGEEKNLGCLILHVAEVHNGVVVEGMVSNGKGS